MPIERDLFGQETYVGTDTNEVQRLLEKYPAAAEQPRLFFWVALKDRCPWIAQLPETKQNEIRDFLYSVESLRRRRQEYRANDEKSQKGSY